jgi:hypothetical protein
MNWQMPAVRCRHHIDWSSYRSSHSYFARQSSTDRSRDDPECHVTFVLRPGTLKVAGMARERTDRQRRVQIDRQERRCQHVGLWLKDH